MRKAVVIALLGVALSCIFVLAVQKKVYPYRWVRVGSGLRDQKDVDKVCRIAELAAKHGLNGILLSAGLDRMDLQPREFYARLSQVKSTCDRLGVDIIPSFLSAGYGGAALDHDKNLAAGLPVKDALFVAKEGEARLVADPKVSLRNGNFETATAEKIDGFQIVGRPGEFVLGDSSAAQEGKVSLRFENFGKAPESTVWISQRVGVHPRRCYRLSAWVKSENLKPSDPFGDSNFQLKVLGGDEHRPLQYENPKLSPDDPWHEVSVGFNSWGYEQVEIMVSVSGGGGGKFWIDQIKLEEVGLVNVLRRPGTPIVVRNEKGTMVYEEGRDFAQVEDPVMSFHYDHEGPSIRLLSGSRVKEGERLRVSFYHPVFIYNDQIPLCMSEARLFQIWENQVKLVHQSLQPKYYMLNMDELRAGGSCEVCKQRKMNLAQILGDCLTRQSKMIKAVNPKAEVFVWSDMLDPNHNARSNQKWYYLAEGNYANSWEYIPKDLIIVCWYFEVREASLKHFSRLGFRTMAGSYYDADNLENPKGWLEALDATPGASGILYTTWLDKYDLLGAFGDLTSQRGDN